MKIVTKSEMLPPFGILCCFRCVGDACTFHEVSVQQTYNFSLAELCDAFARKSVGLEHSSMYGTVPLRLPERFTSGFTFLSVLFYYQTKSFLIRSHDTRDSLSS